MKKKPEKFSREWFVEQGRIGGKRTKEKYGLSHYYEINGLNMDEIVNKSKRKQKTLIKQGA